jgi:hypothetical protein
MHKTSARLLMYALHLVKSPCINRNLVFRHNHLFNHVYQPLITSTTHKKAARHIMCLISLFHGNSSRKFIVVVSPGAWKVSIMVRCCAPVGSVI